jgi:pantoate--beta-alanine ligase
VPILFAPSEPEIYPRPQTFAVDPPPLANELCGAFRPGHFRGMATVVLKMFNIVSPDVATFGKKDYQQVNIVRDMTGQFGLPIEIAAIETVREADGLAMSSRNSYLSPEHRREAPRLYAELSALANASAVDSSVSLEATAAEVQHRLSAAGWRMDYVEVRRRADLVRPAAGDRELVVLAAGWLGQTRLIDNVEFTRN